MNDLLIGLIGGAVIGSGVFYVVTTDNSTRKKPHKEPSCVNCTSCEYYAESRTSERLNEDKTVTPSKVTGRWCTFQYAGHFELTNMQPCPKYKARGKGLPVKTTLRITPPPKR